MARQRQKDFPARRICMSLQTVSTELLRSIPLLADLTEEHQKIIANISSIRPFRENEEIFHEGDTSDCLYLVLDGRVALEIHIPNRGRSRILTVEPQEMLGWSGITDVVPRRTLTARGVCDGRLLCIDAPKLIQACEQDHDLGFVVMHHVANVIAGRLMATRMQLLDMFSNPSSEAPHG
jgi:cAMP-binding proteins - catabolite gene activator and regulatory subunit of cAMP-dependent protein kinases